VACAMAGAQITRQCEILEILQGKRVLIIFAF